jgi:hypothetical protein
MIAFQHLLGQWMKDDFKCQRRMSFAMVLGSTD